MNVTSSFKFFVGIVLLIISDSCVAQTYKYDAANRLIQVSSNCSGSIYNYDANGNRKSITQISIVTTSTVIDERCGNDGQIAIKPQNAGITYNYAWSNGQSAGTIKNLSAGGYSVVITEPTSGFTCTQSFVIQRAFKDSLNVQITPVTCIGGSDGTAKINIVTPNPKGIYTYHWSVDVDTTFTSKDSVTNLIAGTYMVNVKNNYTNCIKPITFIIGHPAPFLTGINSTPPSCNGANNANASAIVIGDSTLYTFYWTGPTANDKRTRTIGNLVPGSYIVTCTQKATGCTLEDTITVKETPRFLTLQKEDSQCYLAHNGTINAQVTATNWIIDIEKKLEFCVSAVDHFINGDAQTKKEVCIDFGWNWRLQGQKLFIYKHEWFEPIKEFQNALESVFGRLEPEKTFMEYGQRASFDLLRPIVRRM